MADAESVGLVAGIIEDDPARRLIVVSAPGKNREYPEKVTDMLYDYRFDEVFERFLRMGQTLGWKEAGVRVDEVRHRLQSLSGRDFRASRGEWLCARMLADITGATFVDAGDLLLVQGDRSVDPVSFNSVRDRLRGIEGRVVIPGFYGRDRKGWIRTLPRDGSDTTGAVIARAMDSDVYEIFSDTDGVFDSDPHQNVGARHLGKLSYEEMAVITRTAKVVQSGVVEILRGTKTAINCRNTFNSGHSGTWIV